ncbi:MAG: glutamine synthetase III [Paludibacteraceae bacterium]|nr:glutamine synthetase III [Paludibacteraceae bacterium]
MSSTLRFNAVEEAFKKQPRVPVSPGKFTSEYYGKYVFNDAAMSKYLSKDTYRALKNVIDKGENLTLQVADQVAAGMKRWAMELGATHYTHWFQPLTGGTAEKHDSFIEYESAPGGDIIEEFTGKLLVQAEPDASSFPSGGIRSTFEARGYTGWDPASPAFVKGNTLCIPTVFISYKGEALDYKAPLLKSIAAVNKAATAVCNYFDTRVKKVYAYLGWEQEYFLVDEGLFATRPDLVLTGRTLIGHESAKLQQLEDHYFGAIPGRVAAYMEDLEYEGYKYGIPLKTCHNEVAPNQFELAPIYSEMNVAVDQNLIIMNIMETLAMKHGFRLLLHEKPFAGINGSGKHCNWSLGTDTGVGLFTPGKTPKENLQFITFIVNALMMAYKHGRLLKASILTATNAHRLGANEAPPAIISAFLGSQIGNILDKIEHSDTKHDIVLDAKHALKLGIAHIPDLMQDNTDRNRTSPFAFTGNRFEFRAVGSSANCSPALIVLNTAMADQLTQFKQDVDNKIKAGEKKENAIFQVLKEYIKICKPVCFDGNGYSKEWEEEAKRRGLDCEKSCPKLYDAYTSQKSVEMFERMNVMSQLELTARNEIKYETYSKKIAIESRVLGNMALNHIIPVALRYQDMLIDSIAKLKQVLSAEKVDKIGKESIDEIEEIATCISEVKRNVQKMVAAREKALAIENQKDMANAFHDEVEPFFDKIRKPIDRLEFIVDNEMWPLPKYRELLFIR